MCVPICVPKVQMPCGRGADTVFLCVPICVPKVQMPCGRGADTVFLCVFLYVFLRFKCPADVALDGGDTLVVADTGNHCVRAVQATLYIYCLPMCVPCVFLYILATTVFALCRQH